MKYKIIILSIILFTLIPSIVYASYDNPIDEQSCLFTAYIEKSWIFFQDHPWVTGSVINCDGGIENHKKDFVYVRILDINGDLVDDKWIPEARHNVAEDEMPQKYVFNDSVYRGGGLGGNADVSFDKVIHIRENQYFFYMPQIHSIDFEHRGIYQIELTYGNHIRYIWFAVLDPSIWWEDDEKIDDLCIGFEDKISNLNNNIRVLEQELIKYTLNGQVEKYNDRLSVIDSINKQIKDLQKCYY